MDARRHVHVHADVQILKLRVHQGIDAAGSRPGSAHADAGLETSGGNRDAIADAQLGGLSIHHANFGIVENLRRGVRHQERGRARRAP